MAALGFLSAYFIVRKNAKRLAGLEPDDASWLLVAAMAGGALGARMAYVAEHWSAEFANEPFWEIFRFDRGGLMFYGGLGGAIFSISIMSVIKRQSLVALLDLSAVALPLGHAFGRIGCFLNGCCWGKVCDNVLAVRYPAGSAPWMAQMTDGLISRASAETLPVLPVQIFEAVLDMLLFAFLAWMAGRKPRHGLLAGCYLAGYAAIRFFTETMRSDPRMAVGVFSISQFICIIVFAAGCLVLGLSRLSKPAEEKA